MSHPDHGEGNSLIITPEAMLAYRKETGDHTESAPKRIILTYQPYGVEHLLLLTRGRGRHFFQYGLNRLDNEKGIYLCNVGPTAASMAMDELVASGARTFINIGLAGGLQNDLEIGDIVVCNSTIGDDGVSRKYWKSDGSIETSKFLTSRLKQKLTETGINFLEGPTWTTSTPYREMAREVEMYRDQGVLTVELEAAALAAVAKLKRVQLASAFVVADLVTNRGWKPEFHTDIVRNRLNALHEIAYSIL